MKWQSSLDGMTKQSKQANISTHCNYKDRPKAQTAPAIEHEPNHTDVRSYRPHTRYLSVTTPIQHAYACPYGHTLKSPDSPKALTVTTCCHENVVHSLKRESAKDLTTTRLSLELGWTQYHMYAHTLVHHPGVWIWHGWPTQAYLPCQASSTVWKVTITSSLTLLDYSLDEVVSRLAHAVAHRKESPSSDSESEHAL